MNTTLPEQIEAIQAARTLLSALKKRNPELVKSIDDFDSALNDAGSTIASLQLMRDLQPMERIEVLNSLYENNQ